MTTTTTMLARMAAGAVAVTTMDNVLLRFSFLTFCFLAFFALCGVPGLGST